MEEAIPMPKRREALPPVLSPDEVLEFLECVRQAKHRAILMSCYAAGLRISEVVRLKPGDIDDRRMVIRIEQGKGRRDRYVMLSPRLHEMLEKWRAIGQTAAEVIFWQPTGESHYASRRRKSLSRGLPALGVLQTRYATLSAPRICCAHAGERNRHSHNSIALGPQQHIDDGQLSSAIDDSNMLSHEPTRSPAARNRTPHAGRA